MANTNENTIPKNRQSSRKKRQSSATDGKENTPKNKKIKVNNRCATDGIAISKQLALKKQKTVVKKNKSNNVSKICSNGKPMPSLADLEKMFEDSDTEEQSPRPVLEAPKMPMKENKMADENKLLSPTTVSKIAERMMDMITNIEPTALLAQIPVDLQPDIPPPPVVPPKKRKKTEMPYIVGCKDRPQIPYRPCTNFCKGDGDYGVDNNTNNTDEEDQIPDKCRKRSKVGGFSKSIFNAQSDEIAERLKAIGEGDESSDNSKTDNYAFKPFATTTEVAEPLKLNVNDSDDSCDSNKTVDYSYRNITVKKVSEHLKAIHNNVNGDMSHQSNKTEVDHFNSSLNANGTPVKFSPIPSTSRDNETFIKNDKLLNDSLTANSSIYETEATENEFENDNQSIESLIINSPRHEITEDKNDNDVQIVETPCETIVVNDETDGYSSVENTKSDKCSKKREIIGKKSPSNLNDDDCIILIDDNNIKDTNDNLTTIVIDDEYSNINIDYAYKEDVDVEIIDIDSIIEENEAIIKKIDGTKRFDSVTEVVEIPNSPSPGIQQTEPVNTSVITENISSYSEPWNVCHSSNTNISNNDSTFAEQNNEHTVPILNVLVDNSNRESNDNTQRPNVNSTIANIVSDFFRRSQVLNATNNVFSRIDNLMNTLDSILPNNRDESDRDESDRDESDRNVSDRDSPPRPSNYYGYLANLEPTIRRRNPQSYRLCPTGSIASRHTSTPTNQRRNKNTSKPSETQNTSGNGSAETKSEEKGTRNIGDCPICMDNLSSNAIASTICGHVFCLTCIKAAIKTSGKRCPTCRKVLKGAGYHQLYL